MLCSAVSKCQFGIWTAHEKEIKKKHVSNNSNNYDNTALYGKRTVVCTSHCCAHIPACAQGRCAVVRSAWLRAVFLMRLGLCASHGAAILGCMQLNCWRCAMFVVVCIFLIYLLPFNTVIIINFENQDVCRTLVRVLDPQKCHDCDRTYCRLLMVWTLPEDYDECASSEPEGSRTYITQRVGRAGGWGRRTNKTWAEEQYYGTSSGHSRISMTQLILRFLGIPLHVDSSLCFHMFPWNSSWFCRLDLFFVA